MIEIDTTEGLNKGREGSHTRIMFAVSRKPQLRIAGFPLWELGEYKQNKHIIDE